MSTETKKWIGLTVTIVVAATIALYGKHLLDVYVFKSVVIPASAAPAAAAPAPAAASK